MDDAFARIERLLAMILIHDMQDAAQSDKAMALSKAGLPNQLIAELLGTTPAVINQSLYELRRGKKRKKKAKPKRRAK